MAEMIFRRASDEETACIIAMQADIFSREQGIPGDDKDRFLEKNPICWCAVKDGKIYGAVAAWKEKEKIHWGRFFVLPEVRGQQIGTRLAKCSFDDLFSKGVDEIHMEARDITVKMVCGMGGRITGEPFWFYGGNVTPVVVEREHYKSGNDLDSRFSAVKSMSACKKGTQ